MKRLLKAEPSKIHQINGYEFEYGIKLNIKKLDIKCIYVQPSFEIEHKELRNNYIQKINSLKINDAISFIKEEINLGYLSYQNLYI